MVFNAVSAIFRPYNGGEKFEGDEKFEGGVLGVIPNSISLFINAVSYMK